MMFVIGYFPVPWIASVSAGFLLAAMATVPRYFSGEFKKLNTVRATARANYQKALELNVNFNSVLGRDFVVKKRWTNRAWWFYVISTSIQGLALVSVGLIGPILLIDIPLHWFVWGFTVILSWLAGPFVAQFVSTHFKGISIFGRFKIFTPQWIPYVHWTIGFLAILLALATVPPGFQEAIARVVEFIQHSPMGLASMIGGGDTAFTVYGVFLGVGAWYVVLHSLLLAGIGQASVFGVLSSIGDILHRGIMRASKPIAKWWNNLFGPKSPTDEEGPTGGRAKASNLMVTFVGLVVLLAMMVVFQSAPLAAGLDPVTAIHSAQPNVWMEFSQVFAFTSGIQWAWAAGPILAFSLWRSFLPMLGTASLQRVKRSALAMTKFSIPLPALTAENIIKSPALLAGIVVGLAGLAGAAGFDALGSVAVGASGVAATTPTLVAMALATVPSTAGSSDMSSRGEIRAFHVKVFPRAGFHLWFSPGAFDNGVSRFEVDRVHNGITIDGLSTPIDSQTFSRIAPIQGEMPKWDSPDVLAALPNGNLGMNKWFVGFAKGTFYHMADENWNGRVYDMMVQPTNGNPRVQSLRFENNHEVWRAIDNETNRDVTSEIQFAVYGQRIIKNGKNNIENLAEQFDDLRHLLRFPLFGERQLHLGFSDDVGELYKDRTKVAAALRGEPVVLSMAPLKTHTISDEERDRVFIEWGYNRRDSKVLPAEMKPGDYVVSKDNNTLTICFLPGIHPHSFIGFNKDGNVMAGLVPGRTHQAGTSLVALSENLIAQGAQGVFLWANGKDVRIDGEGFPAGADSSRSNTMSAIVLTRGETPSSVLPRVNNATVGSPWSLPSSLRPLQRAHGFVATPGIPSADKTGDALMVDMPKGALGPAVGKILLERLRSLAEGAWDDSHGKIHVEFVVPQTPSAEERARITSAFRTMASQSGLDRASINRITLGFVSRTPDGLKTRLADLSAFHINVVAPATAVDFWAGLGMPLTVFAAKLLNDLTQVEVDIIYTGAAAKAVEALSEGKIKADEKGQVRMNALKTPLEMIDQDKQKIATFNQQA